MINLRRTFAILAGTLAMGQAFAAAFTPGNLVVARVGTGAGALNNAGTAVFLDEYTPAGVFVQSVALPTAVSGANRRFVTSGSATAEGALLRSVDGRYITMGGYDADPGTAAIGTTLSASVNRVVMRADASSVVDTTTALTDAYDASSIRSAVSTNGTDFWLTGGNNGPRYATLSGTSSTVVSSTVTNTRVAGIFGGQLYISSASGTFKGVNQVGTGLPTTSGNTTSLLNGFDPLTTSAQNNYGFYFADANTLYLADERALPNGGIQKWTQSAGVWSLQYTMNAGLARGVRHVEGKVVAGVTTLYVTTVGVNAAGVTDLATVTDTGVLSAFTVLSTSVFNTAFRGVAFAPEAGSATVFPATITTTVGTEFTGDINSVTAVDGDTYQAFNDEFSLQCAVEATGTTSTLNPSGLSFEIVSRAERLGLAYGVSMFNYDTNSFTFVGGSTATASDSTFTANLTTTAGAHVGPSGELRSEVSWAPINDEDPAQDGWVHHLNLVKWTVTP